MNPLRLICLGGLLLAGVGGGAASAPAGQKLPPEHYPVELQTTRNENDYGKFDGHGKLLFQEVVNPISSIWLSTLAYYPAGSSHGVLLQHNLSGLNVFFAAEIRRPQTVHTFVQKHLVDFLWENLSDDVPDVITQGVVDSASNASNTEAPYPAPPLSAAARARLKARLQHYVLPTPDQLAVTGNGWKLEAYLITRQGAVEHWVVKGQVMPLRIQSFLCEPKEPDGTFVPRMVIGGRMQDVWGY